MSNDRVQAITTAGVFAADLTPDLALILNALPDGVFGVDLAGRITLINDAALQMLGYQPHELVGAVAHDYIHHTRADGSPCPRDACPFARAAAEGRVYHSDTEILWRKDGTSFPIEADTVPLRRDGHAVGFLCTFRDLTERQRHEKRARDLAREQFARARLEFQHSQLRDILAQAPAVICVTRGARHTVETVSDAFLRMANRADVIGRPFREAMPDADPAQLAIMDRVFETGEPHIGTEMPLVSAGGGKADEQFFNASCQPLRDDRGLVYGLMLHAVDVTEQIRARRTLEERTRELQTLTQALVSRNQLATLMAHVGLILTRPGTLRELLQECAQAIVTYADGAFARIWTLDDREQGVELQASAGLDADTVPATGDVPIGTREIGLIAQDRKPHVTNQVVGDPRIPDQDWAIREGMVAFAGYPLMLGDHLVGIMALFARHELSDVHLQALGAVAHAAALGIERRRTEDALRERADELSRLAAALERSNRELDAFAYAASHDLRAPLRGIANLAQWIEEDLRDKLGDETREMLQLMRSRMHRMEALIEGILQYSRAGRDHTPPERVSSGRLLQEVVDLLSPPPAAEIVIPPDMPVLITQRLPLQQVFMNLIANALKYSRREDVRVEIAARDAGAFFEFSVTDNGPGIQQEYHDRIWGIFQTLESRDRVEATGIGLALVKKLVDAQGGRAWVESAAGRGATFRFLWRKQA